MVKYRDANGGIEEDLTLTERARLKELDRENQNLRVETAFLKKTALDYREGAAVVSKYDYTDSQKNDPPELNPVTKMCLWLAVSTSSYFYWTFRLQSAAAARRELLAQRIRYFPAAGDGTYGYRRIHADMTGESIERSPAPVRQACARRS